MALAHRYNSIVGQTTTATTLITFPTGNATTPLIGAAAAGLPGSHVLVIDSLTGSGRINAAAGNIILIATDGGGTQVMQYEIGCPTATIASSFNWASPGPGVLRIPLDVLSQAPSLGATFPSAGSLNLLCVWHLE